MELLRISMEERHAMTRLQQILNVTPSYALKKLDTKSNEQLCEARFQAFAESILNIPRDVRVPPSKGPASLLREEWGQDVDRALKHCSLADAGKKIATLRRGIRKAPFASGKESEPGCLSYKNDHLWAYIPPEDSDWPPGHVLLYQDEHQVLFVSRYFEFEEKKGNKTDEYGKHLCSWETLFSHIGEARGKGVYDDETYFEHVPFA